MKQFILVILLFLSTIQIYTQESKIDSLTKIARTSTVDTVKINAFKSLALILSRKSPDQAEKYCKQCIDISLKAEYADGFIKCNNIMGIINIYKTNYIAAIDYFNISLEKAKEANDMLSIFRAYNNIGTVYLNMSDYKKAVEYFTQAIAIAEKLNDKKSMATSYTNIAVIHKDNKDLTMAMEYNHKALNLAKDLKDSLLESQILGNISKIKSIQKKYSEAIEFGKKALKIQKASNDKFGMGINYIDLGGYYFDISTSNNNYKISKSMAMDSSRYFYTLAMNLAINLEDEQRQCNAKSGLGKISLYQKDYDEAKWYFSDVIKLSLKTQNIEIASDAYLYMAKIDSALDNFKGALEFYKLYTYFHDSAFTTAKMNSITEMEFKYQTEKKQQQIEILNKEKAIQTYKNRLLILGIILAAALLAGAIFAFILKRRDNKLLHIKNIQILKHQEEIQAQADNLAEANKVIMYQKKEVEKSHKNITDSINYARTIQRAVLPSHETLNALLPECFVLYMPRNIVSGDFYFVKKVNNDIIVAAADCTGHGVPGALLSMLGVAILNELVLKSEIKNPSIILNELRSQLKSSLQQTGQKGEHQDGIDIALCLLNIDNLNLKFSGAYNPLLLFKNQTEPSINELNEESIQYKCIEIKADRQPVGVYLREFPFTEQIIQLKKGDTIYLYSDGFTSQFGGKLGEKYKLVNLKQFLANIQHLSMAEQKLMLDNEFIQWKGSNEQTDDVLLMGFRV